MHALQFPHAVAAYCAALTGKLWLGCGKGNLSYKLLGIGKSKRRVDILLMLAT